MNRSLILNSISKNGKINHFCLTEKWYINKKLENVYKLIFVETLFLDKYNVSLRERIFYIEKDLYEVNKCPHCENKTGFDSSGLIFHKTCGYKECLSKNLSIRMKKLMLDDNIKDKMCEKMIESSIKRGNNIRGKSLTEIHGKDKGERLTSINKLHLNKINKDSDIITKKIFNRKNNGNPWHTTDTISKISSSNIKTHNSEEYRKNRKKTDKLVGKKMSEIMKNKILSGEFTPPITNSWTKWKSFIVIGDVTKKFRSNWEAVFWLLNKNDVEYEKLRIKYEFNNKIKVYIVDFYDEKNKIAYEIKPQSLKENEKNVIKEKYLVEFCKQNNIQYKCISDVWFKENINHVDFKAHPQLKKSFKKFINV